MSTGARRPHVTPDIDKLEGRGLDALIHRRLFERDVVYAPYPGQAIDSLPRYSTDPAAMMLVVERMVVLGFEFTWWRGVGGGYQADFGAYRSYYSMADSAPLAVCRAAIKAVGEGKE